MIVEKLENNMNNTENKRKRKNEKFISINDKKSINLNNININPEDN